MKHFKIVLDAIARGYSATEDGDVFSKGLKISHWNNSSGYRQFAISKDGIKYNILVHQFVYIFFSGVNPTEINHINGIKTDNRYSNLETCTHTENVLHSYRIGRSRTMSHHKLCEAEVAQIKNLLLNKESLTSIAKKFNVSYTNVYYIKTNKIWKHI